MTIRERVDEGASVAEVEAALRWLAKRPGGDDPHQVFGEAISKVTSESATVLRSLVTPTESLSAETAESRAFALWGLIVDEIGSTGDARRRHALVAAFRIPPAPGGAGWKAKLGDRFEQLRLLPGVFGDPPPTTTTPMNKAWAQALKSLAARLAEKLGSLDGPDWLPYIDIGRAAAEVANGERTGWRARAASRGAQPVFVKRMCVTAVMHRKLVARRMTARDVIACEDAVDGFDVLASAGRTADLSELPVKAIWACRLAAPRAEQAGDPILARLQFRKVLGRGERYHFISEARDDDLDNWQQWINIDVDHHGIAPGVFDDHGRPIAGLTVQVNFDPQCLPEVCWWYAEETAVERLRLPKAGDRHLLEIEDGFVEHTFAEGCQPRESYGIAFRWPPE